MPGAQSASGTTSVRVATRLSCELTPAHAQIRLRIPADLVYLRGHFPQTPIVPGVVLTQWAIDEAASLFKHPRRVAALSSVKFHQVLQPGDEVELRLTNTADSTQFSYTLGDTRYASGKILWRGDAAA